MAEEQRETLDLHAVGQKEDSLEGPLSADETRLIRVFQQSISHSGPLPAPETLREYELVLPGAAERILVMAKNQSSHRQGLEKAVIESGIKAENRGTLFGFALGFTGLICATLLSWHGQGLAGLTTFVGSLGSLVSVFIYARREQRKERQEKATLMEE